MIGFRFTFIGAFQLTTSRGGRRSLPISRKNTANLSTHDLTRRSTVIAMAREIWTLNFQLTTSRGGRLISHVALSASIPFQLTTSRGGRPLMAISCIALKHFQLTTSRGGRPIILVIGVVRSVFQLTTSRGGRLLTSFFRILNGIFQLTTSRGGRPSGAARRKPADPVFQLTTSRGGRQYIQQHNTEDLTLSTHDLTRRSTQYHAHHV